METATMENITADQQYWENENHNKGGEEVMQNTVSTVEMTETEVAKTVVGSMGIGLGIGLGVGAVATAGTWFYQTNKRKAILKALEEAIEVVTEKYKGAEYIVKNEGTKKEEQISIKELSIADRGELISYINKSMDKVKMSKKEKAKWKGVLKGLIDAGQNQEIEDQKQRLIKQAEGKVVQESIINKNAE